MHINLFVIVWAWLPFQNAESLLSQAKEILEISSQAKKPICIPKDLFLLYLNARRRRRKEGKNHHVSRVLKQSAQSQDTKVSTKKVNRLSHAYTNYIHTYTAAMKFMKLTTSCIGQLKFDEFFFLIFVLIWLQKSGNNPPSQQSRCVCVCVPNLDRKCFSTLSQLCVVGSSSYQILWEKHKEIEKNHFFPFILHRRRVRRQWCVYIWN